MKSKVNRYLLALLLAAGCANAGQSSDENLLRRRNHTADSEKQTEPGEPSRIFSASDINVTQKRLIDRNGISEERNEAERFSEKSGSVSYGSVSGTYSEDKSKNKEEPDERTAVMISDKKNYSHSAQSAEDQNALPEHEGMTSENSLSRSLHSASDERVTVIDQNKISSDSAAVNHDKNKITSGNETVRKNENSSGDADAGLNEKISGAAAYESSLSPDPAEQKPSSGKNEASSTANTGISDDRASFDKSGYHEVGYQEPETSGSLPSGSLSSDARRQISDIPEKEASLPGIKAQTSDPGSGKNIQRIAVPGILENSRAASVPQSSGSAKVSGDYADGTVNKETVQHAGSSSSGTVHSPKVTAGGKDRVSDKTQSEGQSKAGSYDLNRETVITVRRGVNEIIHISLGYVNRIVTPFAHPEVVSSSVFSAADSCEEFCIRGNVIYITVSDSRPVAMFVTEQGRPEKSISVTMLPKQIPPREVTFRFPEGSGAQPDFKGNDRAMRFEHSSDYITSIKKILKSAALNKIPEGYELHETGTDQSVPYCAQSGLEFRFKSPGQYMKGYSFAVYIGVVQNTSDHDIEFDETSCSAHDVAAVAAWPRIYLSPGEKTELFVVRRMYHENGSEELFRPNLLRSR